MHSFLARFCPTPPLGSILPHVHNQPTEKTATAWPTDCHDLAQHVNPGRYRSTLGLLHGVNVVKLPSAISEPHCTCNV